MKMSEAIREGAKIWPNHREFDGDGGGCCAVGAAVRRIKGGNWKKECVGKVTWEMAAEIWPELDGVKSDVCPVSGCTGGSFDSFHPGESAIETASHLHADHGLSREAVAEWVETIENKLNAEALSVPAIEQKTEETTRATSDEVSTRQIESVVLTK